MAVLADETLLDPAEGRTDKTFVSQKDYKIVPASFWKRIELPLIWQTSVFLIHCARLLPKKSIKSKTKAIQQPSWVPKKERSTGFGSAPELPETGFWKPESKEEGTRAQHTLPVTKKNKAELKGMPPGLV